MSQTTTSQIYALRDEHVEIVRHTKHRAASGAYCGDSQEMQQLVQLGLMKSLGKPSWCPDEYFGLTDAGREWLDRTERVRLYAMGGGLEHVAATTREEAISHYRAETGIPEDEIVETMSDTTEGELRELTYVYNDEPADASGELHRVPLLFAFWRYLSDPSARVPTTFASTEW